MTTTLPASGNPQGFVAGPDEEKGLSLWKGAWHRLRRNPSAIAGALIVLAFVVIALAAPLLTQYEPGSAEWSGEVTPTTVPGPDGDHLLGLDRFADAPAATLAHGDERRLGVARALATRPRFVLMDEPAAGLPEAEVPDFAEAVRAVRDDHGAGVLLIDHNMALVMEVSDRIQVLDQGQTLAEGTPAEIRANLDVGAAYLGESGAHG